MAVRRGEGDEPRGTWGLMLDPIYGRFIVTQMLANTGVWMYNVAAVVLVYEYSNSAFLVGMLSVAQFTPQLFLSLLSGSLADRGDRRTLLVAGRLLVALGSGLLGVWILLSDQDRPGRVAPILACAVVVGLGFVVAGPAMNALVPALVEPGELASAVGLSLVPVSLARAIGPALGAGSMVLWGPGATFLLASCANVLFALTVAWMRISSDRSRRRHAGDLSARAGLRHVRHDSQLAVMLLLVGVVSLGADPVVTLAPVLAEELGGGREYVGYFASAFGCGAVLSLAVLSLSRRISVTRQAMAGLSMVGVSTLTLVWSHDVWLSLVCFLAGGLGMMLALTSISTAIQLRSPEQLRGRVMSIWAIAFIGSRPLAAAFDGWMADWISVDAALIVVALVVLLSGVLTRHIGGRARKVDPVATA
jgi:MFS family permease